MPVKKKTSPKNTSWSASPLGRMIDALVVECRGGIVTAINPRGRTLLGYTKKGTPVGRPFALHVDGAISKKLKTSVESLTKGKQPKALTLVGYDGRTLPVRVSAVKLNAKETLVIAEPEWPRIAQAAATKGEDTKYQDLLAQAKLPVCLVNARGIFYMNGAACKLLAVDESRDIIGRPLSHFIHVEHADMFKKSGDLKRFADKDDTEIIKFIDLYGRLRDVEMRVSTFGRGKNSAFAVGLRDITSQLRTTDDLHQAQKQLQGIVDAVADGVLAIDEQGLIQSANAAVAKLFGHNPKEVVGTSLSALLPQWASEHGESVKVEALGRETIDFPAHLLGRAREIIGLRSGGDTFPAEMTVTLVKQGRGSLYTVVVRDISVRKAVESAHKSYAEQLAREVSARTEEIDALSRQTRRILEAASNGIIAVDLNGKITEVNSAAADLLNRDAKAMRGMMLERAFVYGSGHPQANQPVPLLAQLKSGPFYIDSEVTLARSDGESFIAAYAVSPISEGKVTHGYVITFRDITARKRAEAELRLAGAVFDHSPEGLVVADAKGNVTKVNPAFIHITGFEASEVTGKPIADVLFADAKVSPEVLKPLEEGQQTEWEQWGKSKDGRRYAARISVSVVRDDRGRVQQYAAIVTDITQRKQDEEKIIYQANYDQLTGLPNRTLFLERLNRLVIEARRFKTNVGLMFIDLDGFKAINDNLGHDAGDLLLKGTAERLLKCVREADTVARLGGDEFTVIMPALDNLAAAAVVAARIITSLTKPFDLDGREGKVSASIGISMFPAQAGEAAELLHNADVAMYHAKRQGKANYQFYRKELEATARLKERAL